MPNQLRDIRKFTDLVRYLETELEWPVEAGGFDDLTFEYVPAELGLKEVEAVAIKKIHQLRPLASGQPWGIFFVDFEKKKLPVVVLRRILSHLVIKKRASSNKSDRAAWNPNDLLFISAFGDEDTDQREIAFAHFHQESGDLPTLRVLGWDGGDTPLKLDYVAVELKSKLHWPANPKDQNAWRTQWSGAFRHKLGHTIKTADALAEVLAALARHIRDAAKRLMKAESESGPLTKLYKGFQTALIHDLKPDDFADTYAQTITYGLLTAAISRTEMSQGRHGTVLYAENVTDMVPVTNPFLKEMLQTFLKVGGRKGGIDFDELGIQDVVELLRGEETDLPAILRDFGNKTRGEDPVIHFYEHFLSAYNKQLKIQRGVFYTPQSVVSYIVRSVHELLQTEFGLEDGLASTVTWGEMIQQHKDLKLPTVNDPKDSVKTVNPGEMFVQVLDPATGTATFLVEVIDVIFKLLKAKWDKNGLPAMPALPQIINRKSPIVNFSGYWNQYVPLALLPRLHGYELMMAPYAIAHMKIGLKLHETGYHFGTEERARIYLTNALEPKVTQLPQIGFDALAHEAAAVNEIKWYKRFTVVIGNPPYQGFSANTGEYATQLIDPYRFCDNKPIGERNPSWLLDDYVKFLRLGQLIMEQAGFGVLGMITNSGYIDNPTFRGMRDKFHASFSSVSVLNLNGDSKKKLQSPDGSIDENVFAIQQGVAIGIFLQQSDIRLHQVAYSELWGSQKSKLDYLGDKEASATSWMPVECRLPFLLFRPMNADIDTEFRKFTSINDLFGEKGWGFKTRKDYLLVDFDREAVHGRFEQIAKLSPAAARKEFNIEESNYWDFEAAHQLLPKDPSASIRPVLFRPFDVRFVFYEKYMIERGDHKFELMSQMFDSNIALITVRRNESNRFFDHVFCTRLPAVLHSVSAKEANFFFPFLRYDLEAEPKPGGQKKFFSSSHPEPNCKLRIAAPEDVANFNYIYAVLYSTSYRTRYAEQLRIDFPRLPLTGNLELFRALARLGGELTVLHLLESPKLNRPITEYLGARSPVMEKVSWSKNTVWLDKVQTTGFQGVREDVWNFHIGGYQVCDKWLKDRKGRTLTADDRTHYQKIIVALSETIRLMKEIDAVIEQHGGWPLK
jgi:hypothetical protein